MAPPANSFLHSLSAIDRDRIVIAYAFGDLQNVDWAKATEAYGSKSVNSFKVCLGETRAKIKKGLANENGDGANSADKLSSTAKASRGTKRSGDKSNDTQSVKRPRGSNKKSTVKANTNDVQPKETVTPEAPTTPNGAVGGAGGSDVLIKDEFKLGSDEEVAL